jgi:hypothetical protein
MANTGQPEIHDSDPFRPISTAPGGRVDAPDGVSHDLFAPRNGKVDNSVFNAKTDVFYVNGIATDATQSSREAQTFADLTHKHVRLVHDRTDGRFADIMTAIKEASLPEFAASSPPGRILAAEIIRSIDKGHDVHIGAYSRGAGVTEDALKLVDAYAVKTKGYSAADVEKYNHHITLETFNGFSHTVPKGVEAVHYVNTGDYAVGNLTGMGANAVPIRNLIVDPAVIALENPGSPLAAAKWANYMATEGVFNQPNGPIINVTPSIPGVHPIADHDVGQIFGSSQYKPYNVARADYHEFLVEKNLYHRAMTPDPPVASPSVPLPTDLRSEFARPGAVAREGNVPNPRAATRPEMSVQAFSNGTEEFLHAGSQLDGRMHRIGNGLLAIVSKDEHGYPHVTSLQEKSLLAIMSPEDKKTFTHALAEQTDIHLTLSSGNDGLHAQIAAEPKVERSRPGPAIEQSRTQKGRGIAD